MDSSDLDVKVGIFEQDSEEGERADIMQLQG